MTYRYGRAWHPNLRRPIKEIDEAAARMRWHSGPEFSVSKVSADGGVVPDYTLVVLPEGSHVKCERYDEHGSTLTEYHFAEVEGEDRRLFLRSVIAYVYPDGTDRCLGMHEAKAHTNFSFRPNGWARSRFAVHGQDQARVQEFTGVDVSAHWVERPTFGDWDRFGIPREPDLSGDPVGASG